MNILSVLLLAILQLMTGHGVITLFRLRLLPLMHFSLALLCGVAMFGVTPFIIQLMYLPLTSFSIFSGLIIVCLLCNLRYIHSLQLLRQQINAIQFRFRLYQVPSLIVMACIVLISIWRCYYMPPTPRDLTSGAEVIAEYAVKEKTMINSVFTVNLESTNNQFKPPFVTCLQIVYKYAGFEFGQIWLSAIFIGFVVFLYSALRMTLHAIVAGWLLIFFLAIPEMYAYTFMALFDYPNAVFFFLSCWFLAFFFKNGSPNLLFFSGFMMGIATYIRSETLVLGCMLTVAVIWYHVRKGDGLIHLAKSSFWFLLPSFLFYVLCITIYIQRYLPVSYEIEGLVNVNLFNLMPLIKRFRDMNGELIFSKLGVVYYGYFMFIFFSVAIADLVFSRRLSATSRNWLFFILVIYFGLPIMGWLLPLMDLFNTTKRALFKIFPLMLLYMGNTTLLIVLSAKIKAWERSSAATLPASVGERS